MIGLGLIDSSMGQLQAGFLRVGSAGVHYNMLVDELWKT